MRPQTLTRLMLVALLAGSAAAYAGERSIQVAIEGGKSVAKFKIGDSRCTLVDDQIRCTPVTK
jgi:hypothetical protein